MKSCVLGFVFDEDGEGGLLLIEKNRPEWQKGCLNGIGGHLEKGESPLDAMDREWQEETDLSSPEDWIPVCKLSNDDRVVFVFAATMASIGQMDCEQTDEGTLFIVDKDLCRLPKHITNLEWLIPKSLAMLNADRTTIIDNETIFSVKESITAIDDYPRPDEDGAL